MAKTIPTPASEIELKLQVPPKVVRRLAAHPLLRKGSRASSVKFHAIYFDTPHLDLSRRGIALRLRREGRRWVQAVKGRGSTHGGLHARPEIETEVAEPMLDWRSLRTGPFGSIFRSPRLKARLQPLFSTVFTRRRGELILPSGTVVETALDQGEIRSGERAIPFCELELELKSGAAWRLFEFAVELARLFPLHGENRSKAERGYALFSGAPAGPTKAGSVPLAQTMTVGAAFQAIIWSSLEHLQANERGVLAAGDPEYLHQARVALRRMRSLLRVFAAALEKDEVESRLEELRWLARALGPARDWDVFVTETLPRLGEKLEEGPVREAVERTAARLRKNAGRTARRAIGSARYRCFVFGLAAWLTASASGAPAQRKHAWSTRSPAVKFATATLERRFQKVRKLGRKIEGHSFAELHRLRIAIKKLRYAADFFSGLFPDNHARRMLRQLSSLQDILGEICDAAVALRLGSVCSANLDAGAASKLREVFSAWARDREQALRGDLTVAWKKYRATPAFWSKI